MDAFEGVPVWHASVSYASPDGPVRLEQLPRLVLERVELTARRLTNGVGAGPRRWEQGESLPQVLHCRRRLSDDEVAALADGPDPVDVAGGGPLWRPRTVRP